MSTWQRLQFLCKRNREVREKVNELYRKSAFPLKFRSTFAEWIEAQSWPRDLNTEKGRGQAERLYQCLLLKIQDKEANLASVGDVTLEEMMDFSRAKEALKQMFDNRPGQFVKEVRRLQEEEVLMVYSSDNDQLPHPARHEEPRATENEEIKQRLENLKHSYLASESAIKAMELQQDEFLVQYNIISAKIQYLNDQMIGQDVTEIQKNDILNIKKNFEDEKEKLVAATLERRNAKISAFIQLATEEAHILQMVWKEIAKWQLEQKLAISGLAQSQKGSLDILDRTCNRAGELLCRMIQQVKQLLLVLNKANFQNDRKKHQLQTLLKELTDVYLPAHLRKTIVVEQSVAGRILKVGHEKSASVGMAVRILGGKALGLDLVKPRVRVALFYESDIPAGDEFVTGVCKIGGGDERAFAVHRSTDSCVAQFHGVQLCNFRRPDRGRHNEELVTDEKYAFVFFTTINVCDKAIRLKVISLPVVLITQTSQEIMARGTLVWDAAFSDEIRVPFQCRKTAKWSDVATLLNALFLQGTGRGLTQSHLNYLAKIAFRKERNLNFNDMMISEKQLIKDKIPRREFSFWKWFCVSLNLVKDRLRKEWLDGLIYGFISKDEVRDKLMGADPGTFLLRFSETEIEVSQKSDICGHLAISFVERDPLSGQKRLFHLRKYLTPKDILINGGLATILNALKVADYENPRQTKALLSYLWPDKQFNKVFPPPALPPELGDKDYLAYLSGRYVIEINLAENSHCHRHLDSIEGRISLPPPQSGTAPSSVSLHGNMELNDIRDDDQITGQEDGGIGMDSPRFPLLPSSNNEDLSVAESMIFPDDVLRELEQFISSNTDNELLLATAMVQSMPTSLSQPQLDGIGWIPLYQRRANHGDVGNSGGFNSDCDDFVRNLTC